MMKGRAPDVPSKKWLDVTKYDGFILTALLYRLNNKKSWDLVEETFLPVGVEWRSRESSITQFLHIFYVKGNQKNYLSKRYDVEHLRKKDSFVRWNLHNEVFGARFKSNENTQKFVDALSRKKKETVSIIIRFEGQSTEMDVLGENAVSEELNSLFLAQGISREEISLNYHESKENIHPNCKCGELKKSVIELSKMTKVHDRPKKEIKLKFDIHNPLWCGLVELANLSTDEVTLPATIECLEIFVQNHGGMSYLRQINGSKMSAQLADEVNTLAGQIHAIASGSANKMTTLERRKRQAPKPPQSSTKERDKSVVKRKAPSPPITRAPPQFVVPPPPKDPPPTTPSFSPVGPLSPKSIDIVCEIEEEEKSTNLTVSGESLTGEQENGEINFVLKVETTDEMRRKLEHNFEEENNMDDEINENSEKPSESKENAALSDHEANGHLVKVAEMSVLQTISSSYRIREEKNSNCYQEEEISPVDEKDAVLIDAEDRFILPTIDTISKETDVIKKEEESSQKSSESKDENTRVHERFTLLEETDPKDISIEDDGSSVEATDPIAQPKLISSNAPRVGLYALLKSRSKKQQQQQHHQNQQQQQHGEYRDSILTLTSIQKEIQVLDEKKDSLRSDREETQNELKAIETHQTTCNTFPNVTTKKRPPPLIKPKPIRPINSKHDLS